MKAKITLFLCLFVSIIMIQAPAQTGNSSADMKLRNVEKKTATAQTNLETYKNYNPSEMSKEVGVREGVLVHYGLEATLPVIERDLASAKKAAPDYDFSAQESAFTQIKSEYESLKSKSSGNASAAQQTRAEFIHEKQTGDKAFRASIFAPKEEDPIYSDFHRQHMGQIVFSQSAVNRENPSGSTGGTFKLSDRLYARAFWPHAFYNTTMQCKNGDTARYNVNDDVYPYTRIYVDGVMQDYLYDAAEVFEFRKANTRQIWLRPTLDDGYAEIDWVRSVNRMAPGAHKIRLEYYIRSSNPFRPEGAPYSFDDCTALLATGEFTLVKNPGEKMYIGKKWSEYKAAQQNTTLETQVLAVAKAHGANDKGFAANSVKLMETGWRIIKNEYTGAILYRAMYVLVKSTDAEGYCRADYLEARQDYAGGSYSSKVYLTDPGKKIMGSNGYIDCE